MFRKYTKFTSKEKKSEKNNGRERPWQEEDVHVGHHCLHGDFGSVKGKSERGRRLKDNGEFWDVVSNVSPTGFVRDKKTSKLAHFLSLTKPNQFDKIQNFFEKFWDVSLYAFGKACT